MSHIIGKKCIEEKDGACIEACPVDCIVEGESQMYIDPDVCIDCGACVDVCPVYAIYTTEQKAIDSGELDSVNANYNFFNMQFNP